MSEAEQEAEGDALLSWADTLTLEAKVAAAVVPATGVNEVNYRVTTDSFSTVYLIGRALSQAELDDALAAARDTSGVKKLVNYVELRP